MLHKDFLTERRRFYDAIGKAYCSVLKADIHFNQKGFRHLIEKKNRRSRPMTEQRYKLSLLVYVRHVIENAVSVHDYNRMPPDRSLPVQSELWELRCAVPKAEGTISVVIRKIGNGRVHFLSVWKNRPKQKRPS